MQCVIDIRCPGGRVIFSREPLVYLGSLLAKSGKIGPELTGRLGLPLVNLSSCSVKG